MKSFLGASIAVAVVTSIAAAQSPDSFIDAGNTGHYQPPHNPTVPQPGSDDATLLIWYTNRTSFDLSVPGLCNKEDFEAAPVAPGAVAACGEPIWACSNDACFVPGDIEGGLSVSSSSNGGVVALGAGFPGVGNPSKVAAANLFADWTNLDFCNSPNGVCFELFTNGAAPDPVEIRVYDCRGNLLGSQVFNVPAGAGSTFVGVESTVAAQPIWRIQIESLTGAGECIDDVVFNGHCDPVLSADKKSMTSGDSVSLGITEGLPNSRALLYITSVNGAPFSLYIPPPLSLPAGLVCLPPAIVPPAPPTTTVGLTAFVITPGIGVAATNQKTLYINFP